MNEPLHYRNNVWLASYPKSGNTWFRLIWGYLFEVDERPAGASFISPARSPQPAQTLSMVDELALDPRRFRSGEIDSFRAQFELRQVSEPSLPILRKTHESYHCDAQGHPLFPAEATLATILIVRDPRDVACSWAHHFGQTLDRAVVDICTPDLTWKSNPMSGLGQQTVGSWSEHFRSWKDQSGVVVQLIRYEDLLAEPIAVLSRVFAGIGLDVSMARIEQAIAATQFDKLQRREAEVGFHEASIRAPSGFFRRGQAGGWRDDLSEANVMRIEEAHHDAMTELGYQPMVGI